jgi:hypothetical protein
MSRTASQIESLRLGKGCRDALQAKRRRAVERALYYRKLARGEEIQLLKQFFAFRPLVHSAFCQCRPCKLVDQIDALRSRDQGESR